MRKQEVRSNERKRGEEQALLEGQCTYALGKSVRGR